jgi:RNA polymerase sigma-70 factor (ECF subfamily)
VDQFTLEAARRGDRGAQAALLRQLQDPWYRLCLGLTGGNAEDARDAVQETALRFLRELPRFRGDSSLSTWSMGIAINVVREMRRRTRPTRLVGSSDDDDVRHDARSNPMAATLRVARPPDDEATLNESRSLLRDALRDLPQRQREALLLRYFEGLSIDDTAAVMSCANGTVKATVHQALRALRTRLKQLT